MYTLPFNSSKIFVHVGHLYIVEQYWDQNRNLIRIYVLKLY